jgi:cellulose synthase (UDP-forming)
VLLLFWGTEEPATVLMNMGWATFNLIMLGAAVGVAARHGRCAYRTVSMRVPATLLLPDGRTIACKTENYSMGGLGMVLPIDVPLVEGARWAYVCRAAREPITSPPWSRAISIATLGCAWTI